MSLTKRQRFYKRIVLKAANIASDDDDWKKDVAIKLTFPTSLTTVVITNDNEDRSLDYSFNGRDLDGELFCDDGPFSQDCTSEGYLYLRLPPGTVLDPNEEVQVRVWGWRGGSGR